MQASTPSTWPSQDPSTRTRKNIALLALAASLWALCLPLVAQTSPPLAADAQNIGASVVGSYVFTPPANAGYAQNDWHIGSIARSGTGYRWSNKAGAGWNLTLDLANLKLISGPDNPYYASNPQLRELPLVVTGGRLVGFRFGNDLYARNPAVALAGAQPVAAATPAAVKGPNLTAVEVGALGGAGAALGQYRQTAALAWAEVPATGQISFRFDEVGRDEWSVYLVDRSRGVKLRLDLYLKTVFYSDAGAPTDRPLYAIRAADATPLSSPAPAQPAPAAAAAAAVAPPAVAAAPGFYMTIMADPQYPRGIRNGVESSNEPALSEANNRNQVKSVNALAAALGPGKMRGVIINGDLTEFGHTAEYDKFREIYGGLTVGPVYPGLGNHDYKNNVDDCAENNCANRMVIKVAGLIKALNPISFDYRQSIGDYKFPEIVNSYEGSLAYSWDQGNVHFVQLHNYPLYERSWSNYVSSVTADGGPGARRYNVNIKSSMSWLQNDLAQARNAGKVIVLNYHDADQHWIRFGPEKKPQAQLDEFSRLLSTYQVSAVFVGHLHEQIGKETIPSQPAVYGGVPVFFSGSPIRNNYLLVRFDTDVMEVQHVSSLNGGSERSAGGVYPLLHPKPQAPLPVPKASGFVIFKNEAGYVSRYTVNFTAGGKAQALSTGNVSLGARVRLELPGDASGVVVTGEGQTGLLDSSFFGTHAWNTTFRLSYPQAPNLCFKSYGTTLNQAWNNNCN